LRRYHDGSLKQIPDSYDDDLKFFGSVLEKVSQEQKSPLLECLKVTPFVASYSVSAANHETQLWKKPRETGVLAKSDELAMWFHDYPGQDVFFVHPIVQANLDCLTKHLPVVADSLVVGCNPGQLGVVSYLQKWGNNAQGLNGFDPRADMLGLAHALGHINLERSHFLWHQLLDIPHLIKGEIQKASNARHLELPNKLEKISKYSKIGEKLVIERWIPGTNGDWHHPKACELAALPEGFRKEGLEAEKVARALEIKVTHEIEALARGYGKTPQEIGFALSLTPEEKRKLEIERRSRTAFPPGRAASQDRVLKVKDNARKVPLRTHEDRTRSVSVGRQEDKKQAREYLEGEYKSDYKMFCQLSHDCMPFKILGSDSWYYEAVECVSDTKRVYRENFLALSPHFAAMFQHANQDRDKMRNLIREAHGDEVKVTLDGKAHVLRFTIKQMADLKESSLS